MLTEMLKVVFTALKNMMRFLRRIKFMSRLVLEEINRPHGDPSFVVSSEIFAIISFTGERVIDVIEREFRETKMRLCLLLRQFEGDCDFTAITKSALTAKSTEKTLLPVAYALLYCSLPCPI